MVRTLTRSQHTSWPRALVLAILLPVAATALAILLPGDLSLGAAAVYLLAVVIAAALGGPWSGLGASALAFLGLNFFFTPERHTFRVSKPDDLVALIVFLIVAMIVGTLLARSLEEQTRATRRERETALLNYFASKLLSAAPLEATLRELATALLDPLELSGCTIEADEDGLSVRVPAGEGGPADGPSVEVPLAAGAMPFGFMMGVRAAGAEPLSEDDRHLFQACARQVAVAIEQARLDRQAEGARVDAEANQLRAALFSSVTHDLRTPLASIKASVTALLDEAATLPSEQQRELLRTVLEETDRLNRLVGNILDLARIRSGALRPAKQPIAMEEVVEAVLHRMAPMLDGLQVRTIVRPDLPEVPADPVQIDQAVTNVLENAARYSPTGGELLISVAPWRDAVQVRIADQGPGVPQELRERVFEAFFRRDAGGGRGGTGLGLAIARAIVLAHGGRIWLEGAPSGGAAVVMELPVEPEPGAGEPGPAEDRPSEEGSRR